MILQYLVIEIVELQSEVIMLLEFEYFIKDPEVSGISSRYTELIV